MSERVFLTPSAVGERLGVSRTTAHRLIKNGEVPVVQIRGMNRVPRGALEQWIADREQEALAAVRRP